MGNPDLARQPFSHKGPFVASRAFKLNGKPYKAGDEMDPSHVAVAPRKLRQLFDARYLNMAGDMPTTPKKAEVTPPVSTGLVAGEGEFLFDPAVHAVEKSDKEDWIADETSLLVHITAKAATALKKVKKPIIVTADQIVEWPEAPEPEDDDQPELDLDGADDEKDED